MAQPTNPYVAGAPLRGQRGFFGRRDTLQWVARELRNLATNALVLFGQRRIGKTSLLMQFRRTLPASAFLPIYFDLQDQATRPLGQVLADLADTVTERVDLRPPDPKDFDNRGRFFRRTFLSQLYQALGQKRRPVFLLDEFDVLGQAAEARLPDTVAAKALFPFLREVIAEDTRPAFVFTVGRRAEDLALNFIATFKSSLVREIWVLDRESAEALVRQAEANGTLRFTDRAVARILSLTCCHPYLTQLLCQRVWERAYTRNPTEPPLIDQSAVEAIVPDALDAGSQALSWLWNGLSPAEKTYAAALAQIADEGETIPEGRVIQVLTEYAARLRRREVELAPDDLEKRRVLEKAGDREYRFAVELFRRWVRENKPVGEVKDELDRIEPLADHYYEIGKDFFNRRQWEPAVPYFQDALRRNTRHFGARLHLGEAWLELGQTDEAVSELEQAYELDRDEAHYALIRALLAHARTRDESGDEDGALVACERVLQISPNERAAQEIRTAIWKHRGDAALREEDFGKALAAYREAGDAEKITEVEVRQRQNRLQGLYKRALGYFLEEEWAQAIGDLEAILAEDPNYPEAADRLAEARKQQEAAALYSAAVGFQETGRWEEAIDGLGEIIARFGVYRDVAYRLDKVQRQQELARRFKLGRNHERQGNWKEAVQEFGQVAAMDPDYRDVRVRLKEAKRQLRLETLHKRVEAGFRDGNWEEAVEALEEWRELDPRDGSVTIKLEEAAKQFELYKLYRAGMRHFRRKRWRRAKSALEEVVLQDEGYHDGDAAAKLEIARERSARSSAVIEILRDPVWQGVGVIIAILFAVFPRIQGAFRGRATPTPMPTSKPAELCNRDFERDFECWGHGGELDQSVKCDGNQCYAVLGSPDYPCEGGVPKGEAWIKQSFQVPETISPTLSLRYRVFSQDLGNYDFFEVSIKGKQVGRYGNTEWDESSCDRGAWDSGWQSVEFDLSPYSGERVELSLRNVNGTHEWWNTWTYVEDVEIR